MTLEALINARLPLVELPDLLMEVDGWTGFSRHLEHAGGAEPRAPELLVHCHASILAQACNFGLTRMAQFGLALPPTRLVHHLVFARGNAQTRHRRHATRTSTPMGSIVLTSKGNLIAKAFAR